MSDPANYQTAAGIFMLTTFAVISFWIEILASKCVSNAIVRNEMLICLVLHCDPIKHSFIADLSPISQLQVIIEPYPSCIADDISNCLDSQTC